MRAVVVVLLVACGSSTKPTTVVDTKPVAAPLDGACPQTEEFTLPDGKLRCRELPLTIDFPANAQMRRKDDGNLTYFTATQERGVLLLIVEPRFDIVDDAEGLKKLVAAAVTGIAQDAVIADTTAPAQDGATLASAISFTTSDGGVGVAYAYIAHNWLVSVIAGGRKADTPARPDQPVGKAFLASLKLRALPTTWIARDAMEGVKLELPAAAWEGAPIKEEGTIALVTKLYTIPNERVFIGVREIVSSPKCELLEKVTDADVPTVVKQIFGKADITVTGKLVKLGTKSLYAEIELGAPGTMELYLMCLDPRVLLFTVAGKRTPAELKTMLDRVTSAFPR